MTWDKSIPARGETETNEIEKNMLSSRWNSTGMKLTYAFILLGTFIIMVNYGQNENGEHIIMKPVIIKSAWDFIKPNQDVEDTDDEHMAAVRDFILKRKMVNFTYSNLGKILFLNENRPPERNKKYKILMYKIGKYMEERHLYYFGGSRHEPFEFCSVKNCVLSYNETDFADADAVLFLLHRFNKEYNAIPPPTNITRPPGQRWVFTSDECPYSTFMMQPNDWSNYSGVFNWSMMYRLESDAPVPYGRVFPLEKPIKVPDKLSFKEKFELLVPNAKEKRRDVLVSILSSNCWANKRKYYVYDMQKHMKVDEYGGCASPELKEMCPFKGYGTECDHLSKYLFYLSFENANCNGYMTEKVFAHALKMGAVPIIMGMYPNVTESILPPGSFMHVENFKGPKELAEHLLHINATLEENYLKYHEWRKHFGSVCEDGYMGSKSFHYCRLCEALNYNDESPKVYQKEDLDVFLDPKINCHEPMTWIP